MNYPDHSQIVLFPDVSDFQRVMDGPRLVREGHRALCYKIAEGLGFVTRTGQGNHDAAMSAGLLPVPYFFLLPGNAKAQAEKCADLIHAHHGSWYGIGLMVDVENDGRLRPTPKDCEEFVAEWVRLGSGIPVGGYCANWYWGTFGNPPSPFSWENTATYNYADSSRPMDPWWILEVPNGGVTPNYVGGAAWGRSASEARQFTWTALCAGQATDCNIWWGSIDHMRNTVTRPLGPTHVNRFADEPTIREGADDRKLPVGQHPVKDCQGALRVGFDPTLMVDGIFGPVTTACVKQFQNTALGGALTPDGVVGPKTWAKLDWMLTAQGR